MKIKPVKSHLNPLTHCVFLKQNCIKCVGNFFFMEVGDSTDIRIQRQVINKLH